MNPKVKFAVAIAAITSLQCMTLAVSPRPAATSVSTGDITFTSGSCTTTGLCLPALPPRPVSAATRGWERGVSTGLGTSGAQAVYVVMYKDPANTSRFLAFGYDPVGSGARSLFVFSVSLLDESNFKNQLTIDLGQWKQSRGTLVSDTGTTDGIGGNQPPPRPQLDDLMWMHAFNHYAAQTQIDQSMAPLAIPR